MCIGHGIRVAAHAFVTFVKGIGTPVEKIIQSVDLFFPVQLIVLLIVYQHVNYFFDIPLSTHAAR